jgi:WD40 repeat protein
MSTVAEAVRSPYKGLSPFDETELDALLFFGRERETEIVVANALASRLTVLYGPSGVGKSSLLRAGVVHSMRKLTELDPVAVAYYSSWAGDPLGGLEEAVRGALADTFGGDPGDAAGELADRLDAWTAALGCELCLVLDQFEELFLYHEEGGLLEALPELVTRPGLRVNVVLGIRDDELAKLDIFKARIPGLFSNYLRLDLLDRDAARAAILGPLERYNEDADEPVAAEPELVEAVLVEVAAGRIDPGLAGRGAVNDAAEDSTRVETPYLQLVMQKLWEVERERRSNVLRLDTLAELGGAQRIVEDHLEHAMAALTPQQRDVAAGMFDHLVTPSGAKIAHGVADLASFARVDDSQIEPVLSSLARERILRPTGENGHAGDRYEIYHDVLASAVLAWRAKHEAEAAVVRERGDARRRQRRLAIITGISLAAFALMAALAVYARLATDRARASGLLQKSQAELTIDPARGVQDALASTHVSASARAEDALRSALLATNAIAELPAAGAAVQAAYSPDGNRIALADRAGEVRIFTVPGGQHRLTLRNGSPLNALAWAPDGRTIATAARDGKIRFWALDRPAAPARVLSQGPAVRSVAYSPDGQTVLTSGANGGLLWDAATGALLHRLPVGGVGRIASFSPDGSLVVTLENTRSARIWKTATGTLVSTLAQKAEITAAAFGPSGMLIVTGSRDGTGEIWDARSGKAKALLEGHTSQVLTVAFSQVGDQVATGSADGTARVWNTNGDLMDVIRGANASVVWVAFAPDGSSLVSASSDGTAQTTGSAHVPQHLIGQGGAMRMAVFAPDGTSVATVAGSTARLWEPYGEPRLVAVHQPGAAATSVSFDPTGGLLASGTSAGSVLVQRAHGGAVRTLPLGSPVVATSWARDGVLMAAGRNGTVRLYPSGTATQARTLRAAGPLVAAALRADGEVAATAGTNGIIALWNARSGSQVRALPATTGLTAVALDPAGRLLAAAAGKTVRVYNAQTGALLKVLTGHTDAVTGVAFSPDGRQLASSSKDHDVRVWDAQRLTLAKVLHRHASFVSGVAFSADGRWIVTAGPTKAGLWAAHASGLRDSFLYFARGNEAPIVSVAFSPHGWEIATAARDGSIRLLDCRLCGRLPQLESYAKARLTALRR